MLFKKEHKEMILNGTKTATRRVWKKPRVKVGGIYKAKLKMLSKSFFAKIIVTKLEKQFLADMKLEDAKKEGYNSIEEFKDIWEKINGLWDDLDVVTVVEFKLVESGKGGKKKWK